MSDVGKKFNRLSQFSKQIDLPPRFYLWDEHGKEESVTSTKVFGGADSSSWHGKGSFRKSLLWCIVIENVGIKIIFFFSEEKNPFRILELKPMSSTQLRRPTIMTQNWQKARMYFSSKTISVRHKNLVIRKLIPLKNINHSVGRRYHTSVSKYGGTKELLARSFVQLAIVLGLKFQPVRSTPPHFFVCYKKYKKKSRTNKFALILNHYYSWVIIRWDRHLN